MVEPFPHPYAYPAKATIRDHWVSFAAHGCSTDALHSVRAWFLPGPEALELPAYLTAGIEKERLLGFEWMPERAAQIRAAHPDLPLFVGPLKKYLTQSIDASSSPDWAYLDFDGSALTFNSEVDETISRLRMSLAPVLGLSSIATRDRTKLIDCVATLSIWAGILPREFEGGIDLLRAGNVRMGLVLDEPAATYAICRELAVSLLLIRAFGARSYGSDDARVSRRFAENVTALSASVIDTVRPRILDQLGRPSAVPLVRAEGLQSLFAERRIPVRLVERLRFASLSDRGNKWRWTWYYRFETVRKPVSMLDWARGLLTHHPLLHVVDFTGAVIGNRATGVCRHCLPMT